MTFARRSLAYTPVTRAKNETADGADEAGPVHEGAFVLTPLCLNGVEFRSTLTMENSNKIKNFVER